MLVSLSSTLLRKLKNNNLKITYEEFIINEPKSQPTFFTVLNSLLYFHAL